jgi:hypothetical protein
LSWLPLLEAITCPALVLTAAWLYRLLDSISVRSIGFRLFPVADVDSDDED